MSTFVNYTAKGTVLEGPKGWKGSGSVGKGSSPLDTGTEPWLLHCKLSILNGSTSSHTAKESKTAEDQSSREDLREVKTTTYLPKLQQQVRYEYQKLLRNISAVSKEIDTGLYLVHLRTTFTAWVEAQLMELEQAITKLNEATGAPKAKLTFSLLKLDKEVKTFRMTSEVQTKEYLEGETLPPTTASILEGATKRFGTEEKLTSVISQAFPDVKTAEVEEDCDVLI